MNSNDNDDDDIPSWMRVDDEDRDGVTHIVTPKEMLVKGLHVAKYTEKMTSRCHNKTNLVRFKHTFGVSLRTMCQIYEDLQSIDDEATAEEISMRLEGSPKNLVWFLRTVYYLRKYPTEDDFERELSINKGWGQKKNMGSDEEDSISETQEDHLAG